RPADPLDLLLARHKFWDPSRKSGSWMRDVGRDSCKKPNFSMTIKSSPHPLLSLCPSEVVYLVRIDVSDSIRTGETHNERKTLYGIKKSISGAAEAQQRSITGHASSSFTTCNQKTQPVA
ncbi:hypothetical protein Fcan01_08542, partial [Folsomia candida]